MVSGKFSANQIVELLKQLYFKKEEVIQCDILHVDTVSKTVYSDLRNFGKVWSLMVWVDQVSRFINELFIGVKLMNQCIFLHGDSTLINEITVTYFDFWGTQ